MENIYGGAVNGEISLNLPINRTELRFGLRSSVMYEDGSYRKFRIKAENDNLAINIHTDNPILHLGFISEVILKLDEVTLGIYGMEGILFDVNRSGMLNLSGGLHLTKNRFTWHVSMSMTPPILTISGGLSYRLN